MDKNTGIFDLMAKKGLTTLEVFQNRRTGNFLLKGAREWDDDLQFSKYATDFTYVDILTVDYTAVGTKTLEAYFDEAGLEDYIKRLKGLMREGGHEGIEFYYHRGKDIRVAFCKHSCADGLQNRQHALRTGAMRRHEPDEPEINLLVDGLNLSRAMTYKNVMACLPYGGCKTLVQCAPVKLDDFETIGFLGYVTDRCRSFPGADMGFEEAMVDVMRARYTRNFIGGTKSPLVSTGTPTAYGEFTAIKETCDCLYGDHSLSGRTVAIQGLGHVGYPMAEMLLDAGARLIVTDIDMSKVYSLQKKYGTELVKYVEPDAIYTADADIFSPCAMGGIITEERIPQFKFKIILGAANNQLDATSKQEELKLAEKLADAGILFVIDWVHNGGGVIAASLLWQLQDEATEEQLKSRIELPCGANFRQLQQESRETGKTPTELAYQKVEGML